VKAEAAHVTFLEGAHFCCGAPLVFVQPLSDPLTEHRAAFFIAAGV